jgi:hypothetical protein
VQVRKEQDIVDESVLATEPVREVREVPAETRLAA